MASGHVDAGDSPALLIPGKLTDEGGQKAAFRV
jgi:hypothetical protein